MSIPVLETERLIIRPFVMGDLEACHQLFDLDNKVEERSFEERRKWLQWAIMNYEALDKLFQPPHGDRAIVLRSTRNMIGSVGLVPSIGPFGRLPSFGLDPSLARYNMPEFGLFWALLPSHWGQGYATEAARALISYAFTTLNLRRIVATTDYDNVRSQAVMRRLGMRIEKNSNPEPHWFQVVGMLENSPDPKGLGDL